VIVVLEGADGVGKTSLANAIGRRFVGEVHRIRSGPPDPKVHPFTVYLDRLDEIVELDTDENLVIVDRYHVGELVYGNIFRTTKFTVNQASVIDMILTGMGATLIYCWLQNDQIAERLMARDNGKPDAKSGAGVQHVNLITEKYNRYCGVPREYYPMLPGPWNLLKMSEPPDVLADRCLASIEAISRFAAPNVLGRMVLAKYVVVVTDPKTRMLVFLVDVLRRFGILSVSAIWAVNSSVRSVAHPTDVYRENIPNTSRVISLDHNASSVLGDMGVAHKTAPARKNEYEYENPSWIAKISKWVNDDDDDV